MYSTAWFRRGLALAALFLAGQAPTVALTAVFNTALLEEHIHLAPDYDGGWNVHLYDFDNGVNYAASSTLLYVDSVGRTTQPAGATWNFIGAGSGQPYFRTPQTPVAGLISFSVATEETFPGTFTSYVETDPRVPALSVPWMKFTLTAVRGPGQFSLWQQSGANPSAVWIATSDGISPTDTTLVPEGGHIHYFTGFTKPGRYELDFQGSGRLGASTSTSPVTTFHVLVAPQVGVASLGNHRTVKLDDLGIAEVAADSGDGLFTPLATAYDSDARLYVADVLSSRVLRVGVDGQTSLFADAADGLRAPSGVTVDPSGNVFVADYLGDKIVRFNSSGVGSVFADAADGLSSPFGLAGDGHGNLFAADLGNRRILKFNSAGVASVFADSADGLFSPLGVAVDAAGNVYVADALLSKVFRFNSSGVGSVFADSADGLSTPSSVGVDLKGNIFVSDYLGGKVWRFNAAGIPTLLGDSADGLSSPFGIAVFGPQLIAAGGALAVPEPSAGALALGGLVASLLLARCAATRRAKRPRTTPIREKYRVV